MNANDFIVTVTIISLGLFIWFLMKMNAIERHLKRLVEQGEKRDGRSRDEMRGTLT